MIRSRGEEFKKSSVSGGWLTATPGPQALPWVGSELLASLATDILHSLWPIVTVSDGRRHCTINLWSGSVSEKHSNAGIRDDDWLFMPRREEALGPQCWGKYTGSWSDSESIWALHILIVHSAVSQRCDIKASEYDPATLYVQLPLSRNLSAWGGRTALFYSRVIWRTSLAVLFLLCWTSFSIYGWKEINQGVYLAG